MPRVHKYRSTAIISPSSMGNAHNVTVTNFITFKSLNIICAFIIVIRAVMIIMFKNELLVHGLPHLVSFYYFCDSFLVYATSSTDIYCCQRLLINKKLLRLKHVLFKQQSVMKCSGPQLSDDTFKNISS